MIRNMLDYVYIVHSDVNENNVYAEFDNAKDAIEYAQEYIEDKTWVEEIEVEKNDFGEVVDEGSPETIWSYQDQFNEEEYQEDLTEKDIAELDKDYANFIKKDLIELKEDSEPISDPDHTIAPLKGVIKKNRSSLKTLVDPKMTNLQPDKLKADIWGDFNIDTIREEMEKNEEDVECVKCYNVFPKNEGIYHKDKHGYLCKECEDSFYITESNTRKSLNEGYVYPHLVAASKNSINAHARIVNLIRNQPNKFNIPEKAANDIWKVTKNATGGRYSKLDVIYYTKKANGDAYLEGIIDDFTVNMETGTIDIYVRNDKYYSLEDVLKRAHKKKLSYIVLEAIRDAATELNDQLRPPLAIRRDAAVQQKLHDNAAAVENLRRHIYKIVYRIPFIKGETVDIDNIAGWKDKNGEELSRKAIEKLHKINWDFMHNDFIDALLKHKMVEDRPVWTTEPERKKKTDDDKKPENIEANENPESTEKKWRGTAINKHIEDNWGVIGEICLDCTIEALPKAVRQLIADLKGQEFIDHAEKEDTSEIILDADGKPIKKEPPRVISSYRIANELIRYYDGDVRFFKKQANNELADQAEDQAEDLLIAEE